MSLIGVIVEKRQEAEVEKLLVDEAKGIKGKPSVFMINDKNIENMKNIKFEAILLNQNTLKKQETLKKLLQDVKYLIVNADLDENLILLQNISAMVITYGFNTRCTVTASSIEDQNVLLCVQRNIRTKQGRLLAPQEVKMQNFTTNKYITMGIATTILIYKNEGI